MRTCQTQSRTRLFKAAASGIVVVWIAAASANSAFADTIFSDNFTETALDPAWQVLPGNGSYAVGGGQLRYYNDGPLASTTGWSTAALTLALPFSGTNWEIDTKATYNLKYLDSFGGSSGAQGPEVLVKFNPSATTSSYGGPNYAGTDYTVIERDIDACTGCTPANYLSASYGAVYNNNLLNPADAGTPPPNNIGDGAYWYKIIRDGGALTIDYSYDGTSYATAFTAVLADPSSSYNELLLGGITWETAGSYTDWNYVNITAPAPEPGTLVLFSIALSAIAISVKQSRRRAKGLQ